MKNQNYKLTLTKTEKEFLHALLNIYDDTYPEFKRSFKRDYNALKTKVDKISPIRTEKHICPICKKEFNGRSNQIYCSKECKSLAKKIRAYQKGEE